MSGDNLLSHLPVKFYSDEMTETKKIIYLERKFQELDEFIQNIPKRISRKQMDTLIIIEIFFLHMLVLGRS